MTVLLHNTIDGRLCRRPTADWVPTQTATVRYLVFVSGMVGGGSNIAGVHRAHVAPCHFAGLIADRQQVRSSAHPFFFGVGEGRVLVIFVEFGYRGEPTVAILVDEKPRPGEPLAVVPDSLAFEAANINLRRHPAKR